MARFGHHCLAPSARASGQAGAGRGREVTAGALADLLHARRAGPGRWAAPCPVHGGRSPKLQITAGRSGRVLLKCWTGCAFDAILAALRLTRRDLSGDAVATPAQAREARELREEREAEERRRARTERRAGDVHRRCARAVDALGCELFHAPDGPGSDAAAAAFHRACLLLARAETALGCHGGSMACPPGLPCELYSPWTEPDPEAVEAGLVRCEAQLLRYIGTGAAGPQIEEARVTGPLKECA